MNMTDDYTQKIDKFPKLGELCWYSVPTETVDHSAVLSACTTHGMKSYVPNTPRPPDVFKRAAKTASRRIGGKEDPQRFSYEFKTIDRDNDAIYMKLVRETVDAATNKGIDWARLANVTFWRENQVIEVDELYDIDETGREVINNLKTAFDAENGKVNDAHIRGMIQHVLRDCLATAVRPSGGIYFVTEANSDKLAKMQKVVEDLPHGASMHLLPLVDTGDQRAMLQAAVESELSEEMDRQLAKVVEVLSSGKKISPDKFKALTMDLHRSGRKGNQYADLLSRQLLGFETRKDTADEMIGKLGDLVEYENV